MCDGEIVCECFVFCGVCVEDVDVMFCEYLCV